MLGDATVLAKSVAQGILLGPVAVHVELVRVLKDVLVAVGGLVGSNDALARLDELYRGGLSATRGSLIHNFRAQLTLPPISTSTLAVRFMAMADAVW